jgi:ABC-2 type transport system ATP-binding protein
MTDREEQVAVSVSQLTKRYGALTALAACSFEVRRGEVLALVGPNGAGKTTTLKLMVGLLSPTAGSVSVEGFNVHREPEAAKRLLSFLPDEPFLYELLTVEEFVSFLGAVYRLSPSVLRERVEGLLALFQLEARRRSRIGQLSHGMKSRLALLSALLHAPRVLVMDEPFFGLDPQTLRVTKQVLRDRAAEGLAVVLSTHQLSIVEDLADRILIMCQGRVRAVGSLSELRSRHGGARLEDVFFQLTETAAE